MTAENLFVVSGNRLVFMILTNRRVLCHLAGSLLFCVSVTACATAPGTHSDVQLLKQKVPACTSDCKEEEHDSRYQYYLGVLSVFLLG